MNSVHVSQLGLHLTSAEDLTITRRANGRGFVYCYRGKQVRDRAVMQTVGDQLGNTPAICRKSYVPAPLVAAFESGKLRRRARRRASSDKLLAELLAQPPRRPQRRDLRT
jgi:DNA topoisomerase IB